MDFDVQLEQFLLLDDPMKVSIIGFSIIELQLEKLIALSLGKDHKVEIKKMNAKMKVDLAIALSVFPKEYKGVLIKLSKLRNEYAHQVYVDSKPHIINDIESCLSNSQRGALKKSRSGYGDIEVLRYAIVSTILVARQCAKNFSYRLKKKSNAGSLQTSLPGLPSFNTTAIERQLLSIVESAQEELISKCVCEALNKLDM
ncbi:TPA: hypothetical protein ACPJ2K_003453 [Vibrio alginolyticus]|uniref:hypothetical protein n=1 Tax=Vibrio alginolyticus TaxID=663 RepID=UPI0006CA92D4|nr:hypothetical protein [Vibrio alginolyticus]